MEEDLISVIVPIYNVECYIDRCIESIISQSYHNIEILLVNDGSTDNSKMLCNNWIAKDNRIKLFNKDNGGLSDARNYGLERARGQYVLFVDSDDWIHSDMILLLFENIKSTGADIVCCGIIEATDSEIINKEWFTETAVFSVSQAMDYLMENKVLTSHVMVKMYKKNILGLDVFPRGKLFEDIWVMHKIFDKCSLISIVPRCLYYYYVREDSISNVVKLKNRLAWVEALQKRYDDMHDRKKLYNDELLSQIAVVYSLSIVQNKFTKEELLENMEKITAMQQFLKRKDVNSAVKDYATKSQYLYYKIARFASYHISRFYKLFRN